MFLLMTCPPQRSFKYRVHTSSSCSHHQHPILHHKELKTADGHTFSLITLEPFSVSAFEAFRQRLLATAVFFALFLFYAYILADFGLSVLGTEIGLEKGRSDPNAHKCLNLAVLDWTLKHHRYELPHPLSWTR